MPNNLGLALQGTGRFEGAVTACGRAAVTRTAKGGRRTASVPRWAG